MALAVPSELFSQSATQVPQRSPKLDLALVEAFVRAGHADLPRTQELLKAKAGRSFDPSGRGRPMKEWIAIKEPAAQARKKWLALAEEAKAFVSHAS